ncbi:uncharacterized protein [Diadema setosum]|uniref:uncharacterized protein n=1 Tax=Diadema setosum TaxID=31175 RepID=UPI003B3A4ECE
MAESRRSHAPQTLSELQLYRVLERANLLPYYSNFIHQGGDDVQQLCEAGEDEFLEIMSLVGMGSKPLHVRRLQKALQEWVANPGAFQEPLAAQQTHHPPLSNMDIPLAVNLQPHGSLGVHHPSNRWPQTNTPVSSSSSPGHPPSTSSASNNRSSPGSSQQISSTPPGYRPAGTLSSPSPAAFNSAPIGRLDNPTLSREMINNLRATAEQVIRAEGPSHLPPTKKITREVEYILSMSPDHPNRMEEIHKWASIYGRFDSKRKLEKPLTLHEVTVNEAATQLCNLDPHLILQRDKLFPLARQVVRDSGYQYRHGQSRSTKVKGSPKGESKSKRAKLSNEAELNPNPRTVQAEIIKIRREERMNEISTLLASIKNQQYDLKAKISIAKAESDLQKVYDLQLELEKLTTQQLDYMTEQTDLIKKQKRSDRYYVAKAKAEGRDEDDIDEEDLLSDGANSLLHDDQQQQQPQQPQQQAQQPPPPPPPQQQQPQHQQPNQQQQQLPQHLAPQQQSQPHPDRRAKCSSPPNPNPEDRYTHSNNSHEPQSPQHHQYNHTNHNSLQAGNLRSDHHSSPLTALHPVVPQVGLSVLEKLELSQQISHQPSHVRTHQRSSASSHSRGSPRHHSQALSGNQYNSPTDQSAISNGQHYAHPMRESPNPVNGEEISPHTGLPKRTAFKAQRQMMQHLLMDEGFRVAQAFGEYRQQTMGFNMNDGSHVNHTLIGHHHHQQLVTSQPQPIPTRLPL